MPSCFVEDGFPGVSGSGSFPSASLFRLERLGLGCKSSGSFFIGENKVFSLWDFIRPFFRSCLKEGDLAEWERVGFLCELLITASLKVYAAVIVSRCDELGIRERISVAGSAFLCCSVLERSIWLSDWNLSPSTCIFFLSPENP